jgi:hypothetical protein
MSRKQSKAALEDYVKSLLNRRDILTRHSGDLTRDLNQVEEELRNKYNDPNYGGKLRVRATRPLPNTRKDTRIEDIAKKVANPKTRRVEETTIEVTSNPQPEITGINVDVLMRVVKASIDISDCFFEGTTKEERQQLLSDIERADVRYG